MEIEPNYTMNIIQAINFTLLFIVIVIAFLIFRDARKHKISVISALAWAAFSLFTFPLGTLIYIFFGRGKALVNSTANNKP